MPTARNARHSPPRSTSARLWSTRWASPSETAPKARTSAAPRLGSQKTRWRRRPAGPPPASFPVPSGLTYDIQVETSLPTPLRWFVGGMGRYQRSGPPSRFHHPIIEHRYVSSMSFLLFSMPISCQYYERPFPSRRNADGAGLEPGPVCGPRMRSCRAVAARHAASRFSVTTGAHALGCASRTQRTAGRRVGLFRAP